MKLEKVKYEERWAEKWDQFIDSSINGTFLHTRKFFDHNDRNAAEDHSLLFLKKGKIAAVLPAVLRNGKVLHAHAYATYGGFVIDASIGVEEAVEMVALVIEEGRALECEEIIIRNPFKIFYERLSEETDYAMWYHGFQLKGRELEIYVDLAGDPELLKKRYENGTKYNIKKAWKTVEVRETTDYEAFWTILDANLQAKHGRSPVHGIHDFRRLLNNVGQESIRLFAGFVDGKLVCGCVVFICGGQALHAQYIGQDNDYQEHRPINAVIDYIIDWGNRQGFKYFNLGTANEDGGKTINTGLFHFKEGFGGRGVLRETMHYTL
jgi:hypothetical protein